MKRLTNISEAVEKGLIDKKEAIRLERLRQEREKPVEIAEDKSLKMIAESMAILKEAIDNNSLLMKANAKLIQETVSIISEFKEYLDKEPEEAWEEIDVNVSRDGAGRIQGAKLKRVE